MRFECPGCSSATPFVTAEGGKPVYCAQCGRGYRFIYGFYHRYLYFVFNHPLLTYFLLLFFAVAMARSFPGRLQLLYLAFYTVAYWTALRWAQRSHRYLQQLPTGPDAPAARPAAPGVRPPSRPAVDHAAAAAAPVRAPAPTGPRPSWLAVLVFLLNLALFPVALVFGSASLSGVNALLLDLIDGLGGSTSLVEFLAATDLTAFRTQLGLYALAVLFVSVFFLAVNILAFSFTRGRPRRGRELVLWALVFWLLSTLLLGSPLVSGLHLTTTWTAQERDVRSGSDHAYALPGDPLLQWTRMHAWATGAAPGESLFYFQKVLTGEIPESGRHVWIPRGLAIDLAARRIESEVRSWTPEPTRGHAVFLDRADRMCLEIIRVLRREGASTLGQTALRALTRLRGLPVELPRSEKALVEGYLLPPQRSGYLRPDLINFGRSVIAREYAVDLLQDPASAVPPSRVGELLRAVRDQRSLAARLIGAAGERADAETRRRITLAATYLTSPADEAIVPLLREALLTEGTLRYRAIQALYGIYRKARLPKKLARMRRFYPLYRSGYASRRYDKPAHAETHRTTARLWLEYLQPR